MGGEDIADDDLLWTQPVVASDGSDGESVADDTTANDDNDDKATAEPARKKAKTPQQLLIQAGRDLEQQGTKEQAVFLSTAMSHYRLLETNDDSQDKRVDIQPHHLIKAKEGDTLVDRIRNVVSFKRMKQWKHKSCPCVVSLIVGVT